jgi:hypothetical protein
LCFGSDFLRAAFDEVEVEAPAEERRFGFSRGSVGGGATVEAVKNQCGDEKSRRSDDAHLTAFALIVLAGSGSESKASSSIAVKSEEKSTAGAAVGGRPFLAVVVEACPFVVSWKMERVSKVENGM